MSLFGGLLKLTEDVIELPVSVLRDVVDGDLSPDETVENLKRIKEDILG